MSIMNFCICGKCKISCNKHGKRGVCSLCGKRRVLGTIVENGLLSFACEECCRKKQQQKQNEEDSAVINALRGET